MVVHCGGRLVQRLRISSDRVGTFAILTKHFLLNALPFLLLRSMRLSISARLGELCTKFMPISVSSAICFQRSSDDN